MSAWPVALPQVPLAEGYRYVPGDNVLRTKTDIGPSQRRLRGTVAQATITCSFFITNDLIDDFWTFYYTTTHYGVDAFSFPVPVIGTCSVFFLDAPVPTPVGADWKVQLQLAVVP